MIWLGQSDCFPDPENCEPTLPVALGLGLTPQKVLAAYRRGIFPWSSEEGVVSWWSPDPRMVLFVAEFKCSRSLRKTLRSGKFHVTHNTCFREVISQCSAVERRGQPTGVNSWITPSFIDTYSALHDQGVAHSFETWVDDELVGGLYGLRLGKIFFGESMFAKATDASKVAMAHLVDWLNDEGVPLIDCQQETAHLASLGARPIARREFLARLKQLL
jgi:leucyl/phenylalanyl-tRNA--protein transferase